MIIMYFLFLDDQRFPAGQVFGPVGKDSATFFAFPANNFPPAVFASSLSKMARINISTCPQAGEKLVLCLKFVPSFSHPFLISFGLEIGAITAIPAMGFR